MVQNKWLPNIQCMYRFTLFYYSNIFDVTLKKNGPSHVGLYDTTIIKNINNDFRRSTFMFQRKTNHCSKPLYVVWGEKSKIKAAMFVLNEQALSKYSQRMSCVCKCFHNFNIFHKKLTLFWFYWVTSFWNYDTKDKTHFIFYII